jgi:hypothetical protein
VPVRYALAATGNNVQVRGDVGRRVVPIDLFSFIKKVLHERTFYVILEEDLVHLVNNVFQQFFSASASSKRIYQVLDEKGGLIYGFPLVGLAGRRRAGSYRPSTAGSCASRRRTSPTPRSSAGS